MKRTPLRRRTPLRPRARKHAPEDFQRRLLVRHILMSRRCQFPVTATEQRVEGKLELNVLTCGALPDHVHELKSRARGGSTLDENNCIAVCATHHRFIHDNPQWSATVGLLRHSWEA